MKKEGKKIIPIKTSQGTKYVCKEDIINFPEGLLGFRGYTDYVIFDIIGCEPFRSMLSVEEGGPDFVVIESSLIVDDYSPLDYYTSPEELGIGSPVEFIVLSIVTLSENPENITVNLRGPLFINLATSLAKQVILPDERYVTRHPLLVEK